MTTENITQEYSRASVVKKIAERRNEGARSPVLDDQPATTDHLGFESYSASLRDLILHPSTKTPLTLGIFGRWGTGKTTLMRMLERELSKKGMVTVWFNAWQYSKEDQLWAAFLQSLLNRINANLRPFQRATFDLRLLWHRIDWAAFPQVSLQYAVRILVTMLPFVCSLPITLLTWKTGYGWLVQLGGSVVTLGMTGLWVLKPIVDAVRQNVKIDFAAFQKASDYEKHIGFLDTFRDHFGDVVMSLPSRGNKRLAVFIDDLDRCSPEGALQILDAIKLFVDIPGCVYILGVDVDVVQKAIAIKYKDDLMAQREYLGKIIQLPFQLPLLTRTEMRDFVEQVAPELPDSRCRDVFVEGINVNPREFKRAISIFSMLWGLSQQQSHLVDIIKPVRLAKVVVLRHNYPDLYRVLQEQPPLLIQLETYFRQQPLAGEPAEPPTLPPELQPFLKHDSLRRMLSLYPPQEGVEDETSFANISVDALTMYFTLTRRMEATLEVQSVETVADFPNFGERYKVMRILGHGGMSSVYLALDRTRQQLVALKLISPAIQSSPQNRNRFRREIQILYKLDGRNIIRIYDDGLCHDRGQELVFFAMEYMDGETLSQMLKRRREAGEKTLPLQDTLNTLLPILDTLGYIHQLGIVHRDIKPSTIGMTQQGMPKLMDFGIATTLDEGEERITATGVVVGTVGYISPEMIMNKRPTARSDLYSFGIVLYECLTGRLPYDAKTMVAFLRAAMSEDAPLPRTFNPNIPPRLEKVMLKLLNREADKRYATADEVRQAILQATS